MPPLGDRGGGVRGGGCGEPLKKPKYNGKQKQDRKTQIQRGNKSLMLAIIPIKTLDEFLLGLRLFNIIDDYVGAKRRHNHYYVNIEELK